MADKKITALTTLAVAPADGDWFTLVDISEPADADKNKKISWSTMKAGIEAGLTGDFWALNGNTVTAEKFIGTLDNFAFPVRVNNVEVWAWETNNQISRGGDLYSIQHGFTSTSWGLLSGASAAGLNTGGVYIGYAAGYNSNNSAVIVISGDTNNFGSGDYGIGTIAVGNGAIRVATGDFNTAYGTAAGVYLTTGFSNFYAGSYADVNDANDTLSNKTGSYNVVIGANGNGTNIGTAFVGGNAFNSVFAVHGIGTDSNQIVFGGGHAATFYESLTVGYTTGGDKHSTYYRTSTPEGAQVGTFGDIAYVNTGAAGAIYIKTTASPADTGWVALAAGGAGTVTSFSAGDLSPLFTTSEANPTTTPALTFTLNTQNANKVFAGPTTGADAAPTFRALVADDIPSLSGLYLTINGATTGATAQAQVFTNGIKASSIDDNGDGSIDFVVTTPRVTINAGGVAITPAGSAATPAITFGTNTPGFYEKSATELGASVGGALVGGFDATGLFAGLAGTLSGTVKLSGSTSGTVTIQTAVAAGTWALTLPVNDGNAGDFLQSNGSGVTSWAGGLTASTDQAYGEAVTWTFATSAPSGATSHRYHIQRWGNVVCLVIRLEYATAGNGCTDADIPLPTGAPAPLALTGAGSNEMYQGCWAAVVSVAVTNAPVASRAAMYENGAGGYRIRLTTASTAAIGVGVMIFYFTA